MNKVWLVMAYDSRVNSRIPVGICSSEEKACLIKRALKKRGSIDMAYYCMGFNVDAVIDDVVEDLKYEARFYTEAKELLEEFNKMNES